MVELINKSPSINKRHEDPVFLVKTQYLFDAIFLLAQRWNKIFDNSLLKKLDLTTKQWLFLVRIDNGFSIDPSFQEIAVSLSTTHQNVKQIAKLLETKDYLEIYSDFKDKRVKRVKLKQKATSLEIFDKKRDIARLFDELGKKEVNTLFELVMKLELNSAELHDARN